MRRPAMIGHMPSCTRLPASLSLKPRCNQPRRKLPDCEMPRVMLCVTSLAIGLGVPASSANALLKNAPTSRHAAKPMPSTYGSAAVNTTWYSRVASKPFFRQICVASGVPGNGWAASQRAHAQSWRGITTSSNTSPRWLSPPRDTSLAFAVSSDCRR